MLYYIPQFLKCTFFYFRLSSKVGDHVKVDQVVMEIETDKTAVPVPAPFNGIIRELLVNDGDTVKAGQALFTIEQTEGGPPPAAAAAGPPKPTADAPKAAPAAAAPTPTPPPPPPPSPPAQPTPAAKGATPSAPPPPPAAGSAPPPPPPRPAAPAASIPTPTLPRPEGISNMQVKVPPADYSREITGTRTEQRVKMNRMRLKIAQRLKEAQNVNAMLTTFNEIDMR